jgi:hypothetical protein
MPITGRYGDTTGRPYIEGRLYIPRLDLRADLSFLLDTGADGVFIMPGDALLMGIDYTTLRLAPRASLGVGGVTQDYLEPAVLVFSDMTHLYVYDTQVTIGHLEPNLLSTPSLLGRSIIDGWDLRYCPGSNILEATVNGASLIEPILPAFPPIAPPTRRD